MTILQDLLKINPYSRPGTKQGKITHIVIHWVGNANTSAQANRNYFNNLSYTHTTQASAHYIIGLKGEIIQCIPDDEVAYHSGNYAMNRCSIGIEVCHPDWEGKYNDTTYESLIWLCKNLRDKYGITDNNIIRHYDVTRKCCPKYYVEHPDAWAQLKNDIIGNKPIDNKGSDEPVRTYQNGTTIEPVYADTDCTKKIGSLDPHEACACFGEFKGRAMVRYEVGTSGNYKIGFCKWLGGIK